MTAVPAPLAVSIGDPAGIGPEVIAAAWERRVEAGLPPFLAIGDARSIRAVWNGPIAVLSDTAAAASAFDTALPLIQVDDPGEIVPGEPNLAGARCALDSLELAAGITRQGMAAALVTGPVSKAQLFAIGFTYPGQTEFVAERCGIAPANAVMMLAGPSLRTIPLTVHVPLADVPRLVTAELIINRARIAGEQGTLGREEVEIIRPAIEALRAEGLDVLGPLPADTMFHGHARARYDVALCMYHDQALIPLKALHFDDGVNVTLGLPIVRTSPDHGTAFDIAGKGLATPNAMIAAIRMAGECAARRAAG
jgi:4-hydroxythreonine-4-phosphate dehydrogenase